MRYRIKVLPHKGKLLYMPQKQYWFFSWDILNFDYDETYSNEDCLWIMQTEQECLKWLLGYIDMQTKDREKDARIKKFERDNPVKYIRVDL